MKPGYKTSEFWFTLVSFIFSGFYLVGLISDNSHKEDLIRDVSHGVESIILIGGQLAILYKYINSRKTIKQSWFSAMSSAVESKPTEEVIILKESPVKPKSKKKPKNVSKSRTRKPSKPN